MIPSVQAALRTPEGKAIAVLLLLHAVGVVGVLLPIHPEFMRLTPFNLLVSTGILLWFQPGRGYRLYLFIAVCYLIGFLAEVYGVQTGRLFGHYAYGEVLGPKLWDTPLMIGINWVLVSLSAAAFVYLLVPRAPAGLQALLSALAMIALDMLIEPDAMQYHMWSWENNQVPVKNYFGWFAVSLPLQMLFSLWVGSGKNIVAAALFMLQVLFFLLI
jgi:putative membrane protein